jgi:hypothetical protein
VNVTPQETNARYIGATDRAELPAQIRPFSEIAAVTGKGQIAVIVVTTMLAG